jgi:hypothetical protein
METTHTQNINERTDRILDEVALRQMVFKNRKMLACCLRIAKHSLDHLTFYPDELHFEFIVSDDDKNCIGSCWRILQKSIPMIEQTGANRRSIKDGQNGRRVFEYKLIDASLAKALLRRYDYDRTMQEVHPQLNLGL